MPAVNIYKIVSEKEAHLFSFLDDTYDCLAGQRVEIESDKAEPNVYLATLYYLEKDCPTNLKWNWVFNVFEQDERYVYGAPKGIVTLKSKINCYALTFGHSFFHIDNFSDKEWPFLFARTLKYRNIKTTALTNPHSQRNKTVNTYRYEDLG